MLTRQKAARERLANAPPTPKPLWQRLGLKLQNPSQPTRDLKDNRSASKESYPDYQGNFENPELPRTDLEKKLHERFYNITKHPTSAFTGSKDILLRGLKGEDRRAGEQWLLRQSPYLLHKQAPFRQGKFTRPKTIVRGLNVQWQGDVADMTRPFEHLIPMAKYNHGYKYFVAFIDCFSREVFLVPLKNKSGKSVVDAFDKVMRDNGRQPLKLQTDEGKEFFNHHMTELCKERGIKHFHTFERLIKASMIERWILTIRKRLNRMFLHTGDTNWVKNIQNLVTGYNNSYHSGLKDVPSHVTEDRTDEIWHKQYDMWPPSEKDQRQKDKDFQQFQVGDYVKTSRLMGTYDRSGDSHWTKETFLIASRHWKPPRVTFQLMDKLGNIIKGTYVSNELQKVSDPLKPRFISEIIKKDNRKRKALVNFWGYPTSANEWVPIKKLRMIDQPYLQV